MNQHFSHTSGSRKTRTPEEEMQRQCKEISTTVLSLPEGYVGSAHLLNDIKNDYNINGHLLASQHGFASFEEFMASNAMSQYVKMERDGNGNILYKPVFNPRLHHIREEMLRSQRETQRKAQQKIEREEKRLGVKVQSMNLVNDGSNDKTDEIPITPVSTNISPAQFHSLNQLPDNHVDKYRDTHPTHHDHDSTNYDIPFPVRSVQTIITQTFSDQPYHDKHHQQHYFHQVNHGEVLSEVSCSQNWLNRSQANDQIAADRKSVGNQPHLIKQEINVRPVAIPLPNDYGVYSPSSSTASKRQQHHSQFTSKISQRTEERVRHIDKANEEDDSSQDWVEENGLVNRPKLEHQSEAQRNSNSYGYVSKNYIALVPTTTETSKPVAQRSSNSVSNTSTAAITGKKQLKSLWRGDWSDDEEEWAEEKPKPRYYHSTLSTQSKPKPLWLGDQLGDEKEEVVEKPKLKYYQRNSRFGRVKNGPVQPTHCQNSIKQSSRSSN